MNSHRPHSKASRRSSATHRQQQSFSRWRNAFSRASVSPSRSNQIVRSLCRVFNDSITQAARAFQWNPRSYLAGATAGLNCEPLEDRRLLAVIADGNWTQLANPDNGGNTELVSGMITKIPAGPNSALAVVANYTASDGVDIEIKIDNNGDGVFQAGEVFTTAGFGGVDLEALSLPGGSGFSNLGSDANISSAGEGVFSIGFSCSDPLSPDCGFPSPATGTDSVNTAVYLHPIGSSPIDRVAMVTLLGGNSTDFVATIGSYQNVDQADPVGASDTIGDGVISYNSTTFIGHNDEGDVVTSSPAGVMALNYPNSEPGFGVTVGAGNAALDGVHVRFEDDVNNSARSITAGAGQADVLNDGNFPDPARTQGGASTSATGAFEWTFTDTFDPTGARFFSHGAVEINNQDGVVDYDYGDAPEPPYNTTLANNGPRHAVTDANGNPIDGPHFGVAPDAEPDGQPEAMAGIMMGGDDFNPAGNTAQFYNFPPPGIDPGDFSSTGGSAGDAGGVTWTFSNWDSSQFESLFFGLGVSASLDGSPDDLAFTSSAGGVATWDGLTDYPFGSMSNVPTRFSATLVSGYGGWSTPDPSITAIFPPIGEVVDATAGSDFSVRLEFFANAGAGYVPINTINQAPSPPDQTTTDVTAGWFEVNAPVDDEDGLVDYYNINAVDEPSDDVQTEMFVSDPMNESMAKVELDIWGVSVDNPGYVTAGIDWNGDGDFDDLHEEFATGVEVTTEGVMAFMVTIPASMNDAVTGDGFTFLRARIHSDPCDTGDELDLAGGHANDGEIEDHKVIVKRGSTLHGVKFEDVDGDGTADENVTIPNAAEGDVRGVAIELLVDDGSGNFIPAVDLLGNPLEIIETDANGRYWFSYLGEGRYRIRERLNLTDINDDGVTDNNQGLTQVVNADFPSSHTLTIEDGEKVEDLDFLNYVATSIHGVKFEDLDADGVFDRDASGDGVFGDPNVEESGLIGIQFDLYRYEGSSTYMYNTYSGGDCTVTTHEWVFVSSQFTNVHGEFWFNDLQPGTYVARENIDNTDWVQTTGQLMGDPNADFDPSTYACGDIINAGEAPGAAGAYTINSRDEVQWDDGTVFTSVPYEGQAYNRPMDLDGDNQISQDEIDAANAAAALKNPSAGMTSLIFGNYDPIDVVGVKLEDMRDGAPTGFDGIDFILTGTDGMGNAVGPTTVTTSGGGMFGFFGLKPGMYSIVEAPITDVDGDGYDDVTGLNQDPRVFTFTATSGDGQIDAGTWTNHVAGSIHGVKFEDLDADGVFDRDASGDGVFGDLNVEESGLIGIQFDLYRYEGSSTYMYNTYSAGDCTVTTHEWVFVSSQFTNVHGEFWFNDLEPGTYVARESNGESDWIPSTGQLMGDPNADFDPSTYNCGDEINAGEAPGAAGAYDIFSRDELQWDDGTVFTSVPYEGQAYNRPMDLDGDNQISQDEIDAANAAAALKNPSAGMTSLIFGNYRTVDVVGVKLEDMRDGAPVGFEGIDFILTGTDGMGNAVGPITVTTDSNGDFDFSGLKPGMYTIVEASITDVDGDGYDDVTGLNQDPRVFMFTATSGDGQIDAGTWTNHVAGSIHGVKFEDLDGDSVFDRDASGDGVFGDPNVEESGLIGIQFDLYRYEGSSTYMYNTYSGGDCTVTTHEWVFVSSQFTNVHGEFWFNDLQPGTYVARENIDNTDWVQTTGQLMGDPNADFDPSTYACGDIINAGEAPGAAGAYTINSRDEVQWDDGTVFTSVPYEGQAYNRPMDLDGDNQISQDEIDAANAAAALKNPSAGMTSLIFGNYDPIDVVGVKLEDMRDGAPTGFDGIDFILTGTDGMGNAVGPTTVTTSGGGMFGFFGLKPGMYSIVEAPITDVDGDGYDDVTGLNQDPRVFTFTATSGDGQIDAGTWTNHVAGSIHGVKFEDLDADGVFDRDASGDGVFGDLNVEESGLIGIQFDLYRYEGSSTYMYNTYSAGNCTVTTHEWVFVSSQFTNVHGEFWFNDLEPGTYVVRESNGESDWIPSTGQLMGDPNADFDPSTYACGDEINAGEAPGAAGAYDIFSRDELQWDDGTVFTSVPYEGQAYNRPMDLDGDNQISQDEIDAANAAAALKNPSAGMTSLIFGNYRTVDVVGVKLEDMRDGAPVGFEGIDFILTGTDGMGNAVGPITVTTDSNGDFDFSGLKPGMYTIVEASITDVDGDGYDDVTGLNQDPRVFMFTATSGDGQIDAGTWTNHVAGSIHGVKFEDLDGDSVFDRDASGDGVFGDPNVEESGLIGIQFDLYRYEGSSTYMYNTYSAGDCTVTTHEWVFVSSQFTNVHGEFWFNDLEPGTYVVRENNGESDWIPSTGQLMGDPNADFDPSTYACGDEINAGEAPGAAGAYDIFSRDELQWDDGTVFTSVPYEGQAYNRPMDLDGDNQISQDEIDAANAAAALKNPSAGMTSLIFGNYVPIDVVGVKLEDMRDGTPTGFDGIDFVLTGTDGMGNPVGPITVTTSGGGMFGFAGLKPGMYNIVEAPITDVDGDGYDDVTGLNRDPRVFTFTATSGDGQIDAGTWTNHVAGSIHGVKFEDLDADGVFDRDASGDGVFGDLNVEESGLIGIQFDLYRYEGSSTYMYNTYSAGNCTVTTHEWVFVSSQFTNVHGEFWFNDLEPGTYVVRESNGESDWIPSTSQLMGDPNADFDPSTYACGDEINAGEAPGAAGAYDIFSRDELQWDDGTVFTSVPYEGQAYNRPMDLDGDNQISQDEIDAANAAAALKNPSAGMTSLIFGNYRTVDVVGVKLEDMRDGAPVGFEGIDFILTGTDGMGNAVGPITVTTDSNGDFDFSGLKPGMYTIVEASITDVDGDGYDDVTGLNQDPRVFMFTATSGDGQIDAGTWTNHVAGSIHGVKFEDLDGDSVFDRDASGDGVFGDPNVEESGLIGIQFDLYRYEGSSTYMYNTYSGGDCTVTTHEWVFVSSQFTNVHGEFWFNDLEPGTYVVRENLGESDWVSSTGQLMGDPNADFDPSTYNCGDEINAGEAPGAAGAYDIFSRDELQWDDGTVFTSVPYEGQAYNRPMDLDGDNQISQDEIDAANAAAALKNPSAGMTSLIFGNYIPIDVEGTKYEDLNGNGTFDAGEPGFEGITFELLNAGGSVIDSTDTDSSGHFEFLDLAPGMYSVRQAAQQDSNDDGIDDVGPWDGSEGQGLVLDPRVADFTATSSDSTIDAGDWFNYVLGSIHGFKFRDYNNDGFWNAANMCGEETNSGGEGTTITIHSLGTNEGVFEFSYEAYQVPDWFTVRYEGQIVFTTGGFVSGSDTVQIPFSGTETTVEVTVEGSSSGTLWDYTVGCPDDTQPQDMPFEPPLEGIVFELYKFLGTNTYTYQPFSGSRVTFTTYEWSPVISSTSSDVHGEFWFTDLHPGLYTVRENLDGTDWMQTSGQTQDQPGSLFDPSSVDADGDGVITQAEIAAATSVFPGSDPTATTTWEVESRDEFQWDDDTTFEDLEDYQGDAYTRPMDTDGDGLISPAEVQAALDAAALKNILHAADSGDADPTLMFGNNYITGEIHGFKFSDLDGDGVWDFTPGTPYVPGSGEPGIGNILIGLVDANGDVVDLANGLPALTSSMGDGQFWFTNVVPNQDVTVVEFLNDPLSDSNNNGVADGLEGMYQTTAPNAPVSVGPNEALIWNAGPTPNNDLLIGNAVSGSIHGFKFADLDADGVYEPGAHRLGNAHGMGGLPIAGRKWQWLRRQR